MSEESQLEVAGNTVPEQDTTVGLESAETETPEEQEPRVFTQEELDAAISEQLAKAQRKWAREQRQQAEAEQSRIRVSSEAPKPDAFQTGAEYVDALADWKAEQKVVERESKQHQHKVRNDYAEREESFRGTNADYDSVVHVDPKDGGPAISDHMAAVILDSENGPAIAYYLGKNVEESYRIWKLSPLAQAREIGKIEATLNVKPVAKVSSAPEPIKPVTPRATSVVRDTSDPRSLKDMSPSDWIAKRNSDLAKRAGSR